MPAVAEIDQDCQVSPLPADTEVSVIELPFLNVNEDDSDKEPNDLSLRRVERIHVRLPLLPTRWGSRRKIPVNANFTPARVPGGKHGPHCLGDITGHDAWAQRIRDCIDDHAFRRVMVSYLQFVAYWNEGLTAELAKTSDQSGCSPCQDCQAAHSALMPNLEDNWEQVFLDKVRGGVDASLLQKLYVLGVSEGCIRGLLRDNQVSAKELYKELTTEERVHLLSLSTHLYHVANSTLELPTVVNNCDSALERRLRPRAVALLNQCSQEGLDPYEACDILVQEMRAFFDNAVQELEEKVDVYAAMREAERNMMRLEERIRLGERVGKPSFLRNYLQGLRSLRHLSTDAYQLNDYSPSIRPRKRVLSHRKDDLWLPEDYLRTLMREVKSMPREDLQVLIDWLISVSDMQDDHPLEDVRDMRSVGRARAEVRAYLNGCDGIELLLKDETACDKLFSKVKRKILNSELPSIEPWDKLIDYLENALVVMDLQGASTVLPDEALLSGGDREACKLAVWAKRYDVEFAPIRG